MNPLPNSVRPWCRWTCLVALALVLLEAGAYLIMDGVKHPAASAWERAIFLPGGDYTYFPYIRALSDGNLGEPADYATRGEGRWYFPWLQIAPLALMVRLFGGGGLLACVVLLQLLRWYVLYRILRLAALRADLAAVWAALVSLGMAAVLSQVFRGEWSGMLWFDRIPRPLVTDAIQLGLIAFLLAAVSTPRGETPWKPLLGAAFLAGLVPHGDFHGFFTAAPLLALALGWLAGRERAGWKQAWPVLALTTLPLLALTGYFAWNSLGIPHEASQRLGVFPLSITSLPLPTDFYRVEVNVFWCICLGLLGGALWLCWQRARDGDRRAWFLLWGALAVLLLSYLAPWLCITLTGKMIQTYQFGQRTACLGYYATTLGLLAAGRLLFASRLGNSEEAPLDAKPALTEFLPLSAAAIITLWTFFVAAEHSADGRHNRRDSAPYSQLTRGYRQDFREVAAYLRKGPGKEFQCLATLDIGLYAWWISALGKGAYNLDPFGTTVPGPEIEDRILHLRQVCNAADRPPADVTVLYFHSLARYQFTRAYTFAPLEQYGPGARQMLARTTFYNSWSIKPPLTEYYRIHAHSQELLKTPLTLETTPFDVVVLLQSQPDLQPKPELFQPVLENGSFRVYARRDVSERVASVPISSQ